MSSKRMVSLAIVAVLHVFLAWVFTSGLALRAVKVITGPLETFEVEEPNVDEEPPPPPPELEEIPPYVPPPEVVIESIAPPVQTITIQTEAPRPEPVRVAPPAPPAPPAGPTQRASPRGKLGATITTDDYPQASIRAEEEGSAVARYTIGTDGKVVRGSCAIQTSSNHSRLDVQTCSLIERRFRFNPALRGGQPVEETRSQVIRWQIPK